MECHWNSRTAGAGSDEEDFHLQGMHSDPIGRDFSDEEGEGAGRWGLADEAGNFEKASGNGRKKGHAAAPHKGGGKGTVRPEPSPWKQKEKLETPTVQELPKGGYT